MLKLTLGVTRMFGIRNEFQRDKSEVRSCWFGQMLRRDSDYVGRKMELQGREQEGLAGDLWMWCRQLV